jgi:hypothetical protein
VKKTRRVGVGESVWLDAGALELYENECSRMNRAHGLVGETLLVIAEQGGRVDAG